ncbi:unnamed protein product [Polarella glacialis]|uniref:Uncharacterized protein n=1 Tax=Polarella glacialis TaxID=89957 RepID=A0A813EAI1_POLGL|nr:unnamed protein product [Polarella glacialis]|mmetsp:Transcript_65470/g.105729  ORF Transcript_65470/g.105729 Transcript_65470/m.105729 type:complete len:118 (-) Transcript_65470:76-429(-)
MRDSRKTPRLVPCCVVLGLLALAATRSFVPAPGAAPVEVARAAAALSGLGAGGVLAPLIAAAEVTAPEGFKYVDKSELTFDQWRQTADADYILVPALISVSILALTGVMIGMMRCGM